MNNLITCPPFETFQDIQPNLTNVPASFTFLSHSLRIFLPTEATHVNGGIEEADGVIARSFASRGVLFSVPGLLPNQLGMSVGEYKKQPPTISMKTLDFSSAAYPSLIQVNSSLSAQEVRRLSHVEAADFVDKAAEGLEAVEENYMALAAAAFRRLVEVCAYKMESDIGISRLAVRRIYAHEQNNAN